MPKSGPFRIEIRSSNDTYVQIVTCVKPSLTIGSGANNDLVLNGPLVQKNHARVDFYGKQVQFVQLADPRGSAQRRKREQGEEGKVETWKSNTSKDIGEFTLTLLNPNGARQADNGGWFRFWNWFFGSRVNLKNLQLAGLPFSKLSRAWWLLALIFGGGLLLGSCNLIVWRYMPKIWPQAIEMTRIVPKQASPASVSLRATNEATPTGTVISAGGQPTSTVLTLTATPTRLPILAAEARQANHTSATPATTVFSQLVDGPGSTPIGPLLVQVTVTPTTEPTPVPTPTTPPVAVIELSEVLQQLKVWIEPAVVPVGGNYWRLAEARWLNEDEALGRNYIFVEVVDSTGKRIIGQDVTIAWKDDSTVITTNKSPSEPYALDYGMNASGNAYDVWVAGLPSDKLRGLGMGTVAEPLSSTKTAFWLKFQQTIRK